MTLLIASMCLALGVSFLCSLMEATVLSLTPSQVADLSARSPRVGAIWQRFKSNIERPIAVILILNTSAHTVGASVAGAEFDELYGDKWIWVFSLAFTLLMLQFTEILPKTLGVRFNQRLAPWFAKPLRGAIVVFMPLLHLLLWLNRPFEGKRGRASTPSTLGEISALAALARLSREITPQQERIIRTASRLSQRLVHEVMIPVGQISFLSTSQSLMEAVVSAHADAHTRYPVCEGGDPDRVVGYVNFKEMIYYMRTNPNEPRFSGIVRPVHFVTPFESAGDLLRRFVEEHIHLAIVRDERNRTVGLVTLEDLVEELVGELEDEFDRLPRMIHPLAGGIWMVGGGQTMEEVCRRIGIALPDMSGTVSAWLSRRLTEAPKPGLVHREGPLEFVVRRVRRGKVFEVAISWSLGQSAEPPRVSP